MKPAGFTLLEVLVSLAILSGVSLLVIRAVGDGLVWIGDSGWKDRAAILGREQMAKLVRQDLKGNMRGTFSPDFPDISWQANVISLDDIPGRKLEVLVREGRRELLLEQIVIP